MPSPSYSAATLFLDALVSKVVLVHARGQASMMHSIVRHLGSFVDGVCDQDDCTKLIWWLILAYLGLTEREAWDVE